MKTNAKKCKQKIIKPSQSKEKQTNANNQTDKQTRESTNKCKQTNTNKRMQTNKCKQTNANK